MNSSTIITTTSAPPWVSSSNIAVEGSVVSLPIRSAVDIVPAVPSDTLKRKRESVDASTIILGEDSQGTSSNILRMRDVIDDAILSDPEDEQRPRKVWQSRPDNWPEITRFYLEKGFHLTCSTYRESFGNANDHNVSQKLLRWKRDLESGNTRTGKPGPPGPVYGVTIDNELYAQVLARTNAGMNTDDDVLREMLLALLQKHDKEHFLKDKGGKNTFTHSWAQRFYARHKLNLRFVKGRLREMPADFETKKETYLNIAAILIAQYKIPPELVIAADENNVLFVSRAIRTRSKKVVQPRRLAAISVSADKAQITTTILVSEAGDVLPHQLIFGGTTNRCHPKQQAKGCLFSHTKTHWQDADTYKDVITKILVPYKNRIIAELNLPEHQAMLLKHDLHFSHKDPGVLALMHEHNIFPLFVPMGCAEILHECEMLLSKPFKAGVKAAFRDYMQGQFTNYVAANRDAGKTEDELATRWQPAVTMGALKPYMVEFVEAGMAAICTDAMRESIRDAFQSTGLFSEIRSAERVCKAREVNTVPIVPDEVEMNQEEIVDQLSFSAVPIDQSVRQELIHPDIMHQRLLAATEVRHMFPSEMRNLLGGIDVGAGNAAVGGTISSSSSFSSSSSSQQVAPLLHQSIKAAEFAKRAGMTEDDVRYMAGQAAIPSETLTLNIKDRLRIPESAVGAVGAALLAIRDCAAGCEVGVESLTTAAAAAELRVIRYNDEEWLTTGDWKKLKKTMFGPTLLSTGDVCQRLGIREEDLMHLCTIGAVQLPLQQPQDDSSEDEQDDGAAVQVAALAVGSFERLTVDEDCLPLVAQQLLYALASVADVLAVQKSVDLSDEDLLEALVGLGHKVLLISGEARITTAALGALRVQLGIE